MLTLLQLGGSIGVFILIYYGLRWKSAEAGVGWTFRPRNHVILVDSKPGHNVKVLGADSDEDEDGIEWMGLPPVHVHEFPLFHRRVNPSITKETEHDKWLLRDEKPQMERFLLRQVTHWAYVPGVEFRGGRRADILLQYQATVDGEDGARIAVYDREGKFFDDLNAVVESNLVSLQAIRDMNYDEFIKVEKDANSPLMNGTPATASEPAKMGLLQEINRTASVRSGYLLDTIFVFRFDASSTAEEKLARAEETAKIEKKVAELRAKGEMADINELVKAVKRLLPNASHDLILKEVTKLGVAGRLANSNLQAVGGNAMVGLGNNQDQNRPKQKKGRSR